jgi:dUTP pyrophosphatase
LKGALSKNYIEELLRGKPPLIAEYLNLKEQLQPNGFDLTLKQVSVLQDNGCVVKSNKDRRVCRLSPLSFDGLGYIDLPPGVYSITFNEVVNLPTNVMALATPRSSLLRCGVTVNTAVWDAGYSGRSESLLVVYNPRGFRLQQDARVIQLIFFSLSDKTEGYRGTYQGENT